MTWNKAFTPEEDEYLATVWPQMGPTEIAEKLGRSRTGVSHRITKLGLRDRPCLTRAREEHPPESDGQSLRERLEALRGIVYGALLDARASDIAKLSAEYREIIAALDALEGGGQADGPKQDGLAGLIAKLADRAGA